MNIRRVFFYVLLIFCLAGFFSCSDDFSRNSGKDEISFSLTAWNLQTFFDPVKDGCEYAEFAKGGKWTAEKYNQRLQRLCEVIKTLNSDVFVFEELENQGILNDIYNQLAGNSWREKNIWKYGCFAKNENSAIGCGILSKFPLSEIKTHSIDILTQKMPQPSVRPILEVCAEVHGRKALILVNHWKSKSGGEEQTEIWRDWQENVLAGRLKELLPDENCEKLPGIIICGDFNRDAKDFICDFSENENNAGCNPCNVILRGIGEEKKLSVYSPWFAPDGSFATETGSYLYKKKWERIDHIFSAGKIKLTDFKVNTNGAWANQPEQIFPVSYNIENGSGYSDHLPVSAKVTLGK